jgi:predicted transcriptional regulator
MTKAIPKLARLELQILEILWARGHASVREVQEGFPEPRPAYTTVQTTVYRLEAKGAVRRTRKIGNAHIFEPAMSMWSQKRQHRSLTPRASSASAGAMWRRRTWPWPV